MFLLFSVVAHYLLDYCGQIYRSFVFCKKEKKENETKKIAIRKKTNRKNDQKIHTSKYLAFLYLFFPPCFHLLLFLHKTRKKKKAWAPLSYHRQYRYYNIILRSITTENRGGFDTFHRLALKRKNTTRTQMYY